MTCLISLQGKAGPFPGPYPNRREPDKQMRHGGRAIGFVVLAIGFVVLAIGFVVLAIGFVVLAIGFVVLANPQRSRFSGACALHAVSWGAQARKETPQQENAQ
jgi:hypothetical protein